MVDSDTLNSNVVKASKDFKDGTFFIVGGGNSLQKEYLPLINPDNIIAINSSVYHLKKCHSLFAMDIKWVKRNKEKVKKNVEVKNSFIISRMKHKEQGFIHIDKKYPSMDYHIVDPTYSARGNNTGCGVIRFLDNVGAKKVFLMGFDCKVIDNRTHFHNYYKSSNPGTTKIYQNMFIPCFNKLYENLNTLEVYNCYGGSDLPFEYVNIDEVYSDKTNRSLFVKQ